VSLDRSQRAALGLALAFAALRLALIGRLQLVPDEAYYWEWSRSLDWSYYDQGPLLALAIRAGTALLGANAYGVRLAAVLGGVGVSAVYVWMAGFLGRPRLAPWLVLAVNTMLLTSVGAIMMMHDSLLGLFWAVGLAFALKAGRDGGRWWLAAGLASGLGCLSKYTGVFLPLAFLAACAAHPAWQRHLKEPWLYLGALLGGVLAGGPILGWNLAHGWPSFAHVGSLAGADASRRSLATLPEFLGSQLGLATPLLFGLMLAALLGAWRDRRALAPERALLAASAALVLGFFTALSLHTRVEGNWPAEAYLGALPLTALWLDDRGALWGRASRWALGVAAAFTLLAHSQAAFGWIPFPAERAAKLDRSYLMQGWAELAGQVEAERAKLGPQAFVGCRTYQNAAELAFYLPGQARPLILQKGPINHQYRFWNQPQAFAGRDAVLVVGQDWEVDEMRQMFASVTELPPCETGRRGVVLRRTRLYVGRDFRPLP
jgi:4-amino-4-deoxy-L-arabinose transferase-like glycosyltransferase